VSYFTRYFRRQPDSPLPAMAIFAIRTVLDHLMVLGFNGDHDTYAITMAAAAWDDDLRELRHDWAWDAVARGLPTSAPWAAPEHGTPLCSVLTMTGHRNVRREFVRDGDPAVLGLLAVGDALCTTNPAYGWGASMALTYAFAACEAIDAGTDDLTILARRYDAAVADEVDAVYDESATSDRLRGYRWRGEDVPDFDRKAAEQEALIEEGIAPGIFLDAVLARAFLRRTNLVEPPSALFANQEVVERAEKMRAKLAARAQRDGVDTPPTRDDVVAMIAAARPA